MKEESHVTIVYFRFWIFTPALFLNIRTHGIVIHHTFFFTNLSCSLTRARHSTVTSVDVRSYVVLEIQTVSSINFNL